MATIPSLKVLRPDANFVHDLEPLFAALVASGDDRRFHPHPLDHTTAEWICRYRGSDEYRVAVWQQQLVGYGMLRGWDKGFVIPSLGIAVHPDHRRRGIGRAFMHELHAIARNRGAALVRLTVDVNNVEAIALYQSLGYRLEVVSEATGSDRLVGMLEFGSDADGSA